jgi:hypothetical protein
MHGGGDKDTLSPERLRACCGAVLKPTHSTFVTAGVEMRASDANEDKVP